MGTSTLFPKQANKQTKISKQEKDNKMTKKNNGEERGEMIRSLKLLEMVLLSRIQELTGREE